MPKVNILLKELSKAIVEKDVENVYRQLLKIGIPDSEITSPYGGDGVLNSELNDLIMLLEFKYDYNFQSKGDVIKVLIQSLYYLKKTEFAGDRLPSIIFVGDIDECFILHTNSIQHYLDANIDWTIAPSTAPSKNPELKVEMYNDDKINPFVFDINQSLEFSTVVNQILDLNNNIVRLVRITEKNINKIFDYFCDNVFPKSKLDANNLVGLFINVLTNPNENYIHPKKKNTLITPNGEYSVRGDKFKAFFSHFEREYKPSEREKLVEICDRLIDDVERRMQGAFFTPTPIVDVAHKEIADKFGEDWKEEYVVWDCCSGTGNLTRDYKFKELYSSTLMKDEHDIKMQNSINPEATHFVYDFLSCIIEDTLFGNGEEAFPEGLVEAFKQNKKIIVIMNPPYGTAGNYGETSKGDIAKTFINNEMKKDKMGACCQNLYPQFMYKITKLKEYYGLDNINICQFTKSLFLTGGSYQKFRDYFFSNFKFEFGYMVQASVFADVKGLWGVLFSIWKSGENDCDEFEVELLEKFEDENDFEIFRYTDKKKLYNLDNSVKANKWVKEEIKGVKAFDAPQFSSAIKVKQSGRGKIASGEIGYFNSNIGSVYTNEQQVNLFSGCYSVGNGLSVIPENFDKVVSLFTARKLITGKYANWINDKDEYSKPDVEHDDYEQWNNDCVIYSLFNTSSNQSSLRDVDYKDKVWQIENEFFWLSTDFIKDLADKHNNNEVYQDVKHYGKERFVCKKLSTIILSDDAKLILDKATELLVKTFKYRQMMNEEHPNYNLQAWDAGWYQVKLIAKEYCKDELKEFQELYKQFSDRLRPFVYELGFLRK